MVGTLAGLGRREGEEERGEGGGRGAGRGEEEEERRGGEEAACVCVCGAALREGEEVGRREVALNSAVSPAEASGKARTGRFFALSLFPWLNTGSPPPSPPTFLLGQKVTVLFGRRESAEARERG